MERRYETWKRKINLAGWSKISWKMERRYETWIRNAFLSKWSKI